MLDTKLKLRRKKIIILINTMFLKESRKENVKNIIEKNDSQKIGRRQIVL